MGIVLGFICVVLIIIGIVNFKYYNEKEDEYYKAKGKIIAYNEFQDRTSKGAALSMYYYPVVEYQDREGKIQQIVSEDCNIDAPMFPVGTKINLLVNPNDNTRILFDTATDKWQVPMICIATGVVGLVLIICYILFSMPTEKVPLQENLKYDSSLNQLPQDVKDSILSIMKK